MSDNYTPNGPTSARPDRIWLKRSWAGWTHSEHPQDDALGPEYIRADLHETARAAARAEGIREAARHHQDEINRLNEVIASNDEYAARTGKDVSPSNVICYDKRAAHEAAMRAILKLLPQEPPA